MKFVREDTGPYLKRKKKEFIVDRGRMRGHIHRMIQSWKTQWAMWPGREAWSGHRRGFLCIVKDWELCPCPTVDPTL